ncbi:MAG: hypothetical protein WCF04_02585 [Candidatus Nanopelagicales bacterium]
MNNFLAGVRTRPGLRGTLAAITALAISTPMLPLAAAPAAAASPGCTVAIATRVDLGVANTDSASCADPSRAYNYVDLKAGDVLWVKFDGRKLEPSVEAGVFELFNPGVTDQSIAKTEGVELQAVSSGSLEQGAFRVYESGRFIIQWRNARGMVFTPWVSRVTPNAHRVSGACRITVAPVATRAVVQYSDPRACDPTGRFWKIHLVAGDQLNLPVEHFSGDGRAYAAVRVYQPGVTDSTLSKADPWCSANVEGRAVLRCNKAPKTGWYVIRHSYGRASLQPVVTPSFRNPKVRVWTYKKATRLEVDVDPDLGWEWKVQLQKRVHGRWFEASGVKTTVKTHYKFNPKRGRYRVVVYGVNGYTSATSASVYVRK